MTAVHKAVVCSCFCACSIIAVAGIDRSLFRSSDKKSRVGLWEGYSGGCKIFGFMWWDCSQFEIFLGLRQHINCPAADNTVRRCCQDVMRILRANYRNTVNWMSVPRASERCLLYRCASACA